MAANMNEVDSLVNISKTVADIKAMANDAVKKFQGSVNNVKDAIAQTHSASDQLDKAASDIRGAFGIQSNGPPA